MEQAGVLEVTFDADGTERWTLTAMGASMGRQLAMRGDEASFSVMPDALLEASGAEK